MTRPLLLALALASGALLAAGASAQTKGGPFRALGLSAADLEAAEPASANPFTALLRPGVQPDVAYWTAKTQIESRARGQRRALRGLSPAPTARVRERERGRVGSNDDVETAQVLTGLRAEDEPRHEITGTLAPVPVSEVFATDTERDEGETASGAIDPWRLEIASGDNAAVAITATIGDGTYGATTGDVDAYEFDVRQPDTYLRLAVETPESDLDPVMALYGPEGYPILVNDDAFPGTDSAGRIFLARPGLYRLYVWGYTNGSPVSGLADPFDPASGAGVGSTGSYLLRAEALRPDTDHYAVHLRAGDVLAVATASEAVSDLAILDPDGETRMLSRVDFSLYYGEGGPLVSPTELAGGGDGVTAALVAPVSGTYTVAARGEGDYALTLQVLPSGPQRAPQGGPETLFVDFDGGTFTPLADLGEGHATATLSPLADFLPRWDLAPEDEDAVIDAVLARLAAHLRDALREDVPGMAGLDLQILNSRDHADPGPGAGVARIVIGGTEGEIGIEGIYGQASSIDIGNFTRDDIAYVLLDAYSDPAESPSSLNQFGVDSTRSKVDLVALGVAFTAAHEAGHFFGLHHTHNDNATANIMDEGGGDLAAAYDLGADGVFGPGDGAGVRFRKDVFQAYYPFAGVQRTPDALALSLGDPPADDRITAPEAIAEAVAGFSAGAREAAVASGSVRLLYGAPGPVAPPEAWNVTTAPGGGVQTRDGRTVTVTAAPQERVRARAGGALVSPGGVMIRTSVRRLPGGASCGAAGFFSGLASGRDAHVLVDAGGPEGARYAYLAGEGWAPLAQPPLSTFTLELVAANGRGHLFLDGEPVRAASGAEGFAMDTRAGAFGLTVNGCGGAPARFAFSDVEAFAIGERVPALTRPASGGTRRFGARGPGAEGASVRSSAPPQALKPPSAGMAGPVRVAPAAAGPAGYVFTFRHGVGLWRVRLAVGSPEASGEGGSVWVQPPGAQTWREARPGEVDALLGASLLSVTAESPLSQSDATAATEALRRASAE